MMSSEQTPAQIIREQLGKAFDALTGSSFYVSTHDGRGLRFRFGGNPKRITNCEIVLDYATDTYTVSFEKHSKSSPNMTMVFSKHENVYVEDFHELIEENTGLLTRFRQR